jgi:hypothetical protein
MIFWDVQLVCVSSDCVVTEDSRVTFSYL